MASLVDLQRELENLRDIFPLYTRGHDDGRIRGKVEVVFKIVEDGVSFFVLEVGLG